MGEGHAYPMVAFGTLKKKAAFKMFARAKEMDFDLANEISKQIEMYEKDLSHAEDDVKDTIDIYDYVDEQYHEYIDQSQKYWGIIDNKKKAPCAFLLYDGDIPSEIGLIKCKSETTKKEYITTVIDGAIAEKYKFLKNDLLKVNTVLLTDLVFNRIGIQPYNVTELSELVTNDPKVWKLYEQGITVGINQCEQASARKKIVKYKPKNISELAAFIAGIRPGFKSMYPKFESRVPFNYGISAFDNLIQTKEFPYSFIMYQEQLMTVLNYAGFPMDQCYQIIKDIAKKHPEKVIPLKEQFLNGFAERIKNDCHNEDEAREIANKVWQIVQDNTGYGFNSSHAYAMALDSLYGAWQKANYPYEFYEVYLQFYSNEGEKDKVAELKQEMEKCFGIKEGKYKWGVDNRTFKADKEKGEIIPALISLKGLSQKCSEKLYYLSQNYKFDNFADLWITLMETSHVNKGHIEKLIKLDYFSEFGEINQILRFVEIAEEIYKRSQFNKEKDKKLIQELSKFICPEYCEEKANTYKNFQYEKALREIWNDILCDKSIPKTSIITKLNYEFELLGFLRSKANVRSCYGYVIEVNAKYKNKIIKVYNIRTGDIKTYKVKSKNYDMNPIEEQMVINIIDKKEEKRWQKNADGDWIRIDETETILYKWSKVEC